MVATSIFFIGIIAVQVGAAEPAGRAGGPNSPWTSPQNMERTMTQSPISAASKVKAPTLILDDMGDYRVAITESFECSTRSRTMA
jgi:hypothetical protein